jgi:hypothetical protein
VLLLHVCEHLDVQASCSLGGSRRLGGSERSEHARPPKLLGPEFPGSLRYATNLSNASVMVLLHIFEDLDTQANFSELCGSVAKLLDPTKS